jgi:hypothetical protein
MPILKFQCSSCGLSSRKRVGKQTNEIKCDCGMQAQVVLSASASVGFTSKVDQTMKVQSSGVDSFDLDFDRVIGEDAQQKWEQIYRRRRDKWDLIESHNVTGKDLIRMDDQTYQVLPEMGKNLRSSRVSAMDNIKSSSSTNQ